MIAKDKAPGRPAVWLGQVVSPSANDFPSAGIGWRPLRIGDGSARQIAELKVLL